MSGGDVKVLWVGEVGCSPEAIGSVVGRIEIAFSDAVPEFEVAEDAWPAGRRLTVHSRWKAFGADFQQQLLNRFFTDEMLSCRPDVVMVDLLCGATMDLPRVATILGCPVVLRVPADPLPAADARAMLWFRDTVAAADCILTRGEPVADEAFGRCFPEAAGRVVADAESAISRLARRQGAEALAFDYGRYAFGLRDHGLLYRMQASLAAHFAGCGEVLELACGVGIFLDILQREGIAAFGVERDPASVRYARGLGLKVEESDALTYLEQASGRFDGIYCSHFVEHLPVEAVDRLIALVAKALRPGGVALFVFPDPESIRSQLLGFWRDPEHVRFYHPDLIELMCRSHGLQTDFHSHRVPGRRVVSFAPEAPLGQPDDEVEPAPGVQIAPPSTAGRWWSQLLARFGVAGSGRLWRAEQELARVLAAERERNRRLQARVEQLEQAVRKLWDVNQTWAWDDNAVLRMRKPA